MNAGGNLAMDWLLIWGRGEGGSSNTPRYAKVSSVTWLDDGAKEGQF